MYNSVLSGGFHHHGGFLGGYLDFYRGGSDNPADNFRDKYDDDNGEEEYEDTDDVLRPLDGYSVNRKDIDYEKEYPEYVDVKNIEDGSKYSVDNTTSHPEAI